MSVSSIGSTVASYSITDSGDQQTLELRRELLRVDAQKQKAMNPERENG